MPRDWFDEFFDQPYFICEDGDQGAKIKAICVLLGVQVDEAFGGFALAVGGRRWYRTPTE
jgi:hypothetical protein